MGSKQVLIGLVCIISSIFIMALTPVTVQTFESPIPAPEEYIYLGVSILPTPIPPQTTTHEISLLVAEPKPSSTLVLHSSQTDMETQDEVLFLLDETGAVNNYYTWLAWPGFVMIVVGTIMELRLKHARS